MKKCFFGVALLALTSCTNTPSSNEGNQMTEENQVTEENQGWEKSIAPRFSKEVVAELVNEFSDKITSGKYKEALSCYDPEYVAEQHDSFLEGRTNQFISESICGELIVVVNEDKDFSCPELDMVASIRIMDVVNQGEDYDLATLEVTLKNGNIIRAEAMIHPVVVDGKVKPLFRMAVG